MGGVVGQLREGLGFFLKWVMCFLVFYSGVGVAPTGVGRGGGFSRVSGALWAVYSVFLFTTR